MNMACILRCLKSLILSLDDHYIRPQCHKERSWSEMLLLYRYFYSPKVTVVLYSKTEHIFCIYKKRFLRSVLILNKRDAVWKSNSFNFPSLFQEVVLFGVLFLGQCAFSTFLPRSIHRLKYLSTLAETTAAFWNFIDKIPFSVWQQQPFRELNRTHCWSWRIWKEIFLWWQK